MNVLVIGRAKTGTTVISKTLQNSTKGECSYWLEPKTIDFFLSPEDFAIHPNNVAKIIFEHWDHTPRFRNGLIHDESALKFDRVVAIVRDPRDELLSRLLYVIKPWMDANGIDEQKNELWLEVLDKKESDPSRYSFLSIVREFDEIYGTHMESQVVQPKPYANYFNFLSQQTKKVFVLKYEDFMCGELAALEQYCGFPLAKSRDVGDLARTKRSASFDNWKTFFTEEDVAELRPIYESIMAQHGYCSWELDTPEQLDSSAYTDYIRRLVSEEHVNVQATLQAHR